MKTITLPLKDEYAAAQFGAALAPVLKPADVIYLAGPLGAGKTTLARGLIRAFCDSGEVPSPTFTLVETYDANGFSLWHFDLYRLEKSTDVWELGLEESLSEGVSIIEWPERIAGLLPDNALRLNIDIAMDRAEQSRLLRINGDDQWRNRLSDAGIV